MRRRAGAVCSTALRVAAGSELLIAHMANATAQPSDPTFAFLSGEGAVAKLMRSLDWSRSPLGPPAEWPQSLRSVVGLMLGSKFPMFVAWGPELGFLYNEPYAAILGESTRTP